MALSHVICDYGVGDGAFSEVIQKLHQFAPDHQYLPLAVPAFSTLATGFWIAQLGMYQPSDKIIIFSNTAPRHDTRIARDKNEGEKFAIAKLKNGTYIGAVNAGWAFSFVKDQIESFHIAQSDNKGSQFRSRDFYPQAFIETLTGKRPLADPLDIASIPSVPANKISYVDGYGNIKTTITQSHVSQKGGDKVMITIGEITFEAIVSDGMFNIPTHSLVFAPGSSGDPQDPFMEISLRSAHVGDPSAWSMFGHPHVEAEIEVGS